MSLSSVETRVYFCVVFFVIAAGVGPVNADAVLDSGQLAGLIFGVAFGTLFVAALVALAILYCYRNGGLGNGAKANQGE